MEYTALCDELWKSTEILRALLDGVTQEQSRVKPASDSWSILEVVCHLYDEEREDFREHLDFILHRQNEQWYAIDPEGWVTDRKYNQQDFDESRAIFLAERAKSLEWLGGLANADWNKVYTSEFGSLSAGDMFASWVAHDNLHIRQLVELRRHRLLSLVKPYSADYAGDW